LRAEAIVPSADRAWLASVAQSGAASGADRESINFGVADIASIRMSETLVFLAVVLDGFSRRVVGWATADHLRAELALSALDMAIGNRYVTTGELIHHSDQGVQAALK
jgi:transposase InsO family protein